MNTLGTDLKKLVTDHGLKGIILLICMEFGAIVLLTSLLGLVVNLEDSVISTPWWALLFACSSVSISWLRAKSPDQSVKHQTYKS